MARNIYILAVVLIFFAAVCFGMSLVASHTQPSLPANGTLWKSTGLFLLVAGLVSALFGIVTTLFEQIDRRSEERRMRHRNSGSR